MPAEQPYYKKHIWGIPLVVQWLSLLDSNAGVQGACVLSLFRELAPYAVTRSSHATTKKILRAETKT